MVRGEDGGHTTRVVAGRGVLLLVGGLVLLIDDDKAEVAEGEEHRGTHAQDDVVGGGGELALPQLDALGIGELGVVYAQARPEGSAQALGHLLGEGYLGHEEQGLTAPA